MKLKNTEHEAIVHSQNEAMPFTIESSVKAFEIISQTIYTNPKKAVVRELLCNAWDSHQLARNYKTDIYCHLPTRVEPYLIIRDYGVGMSVEQIKNVYTVAFKSTKEQDETQTGALGIGSKTPFAYDKEQAFTVTSWFGGIKYIYSVYMHKGAPQCLPLSQTPSDEPSGVEIRIEIKSEDFDAFKDAAIASAYTMKSPSVQFNLDVKLPVANYESDLYSMYSGERCISAEMCNVVYPINKKELKNQEIYTHLYELLPYGTHQQRILIHFDSGELKFQASREQLYYDNEYIDIIESKMQMVIDKFINDAQKDLDDQMIDDWKLAYRYVSTMHNSYVVSKLIFDGKPFPEYVDEVNKRNMVISSNLGAMDDCAIRYRLNVSGARRVKFVNNYRRTEFPMHYLPTESKSKHSFFINDLGRKGTKYITKFMEHHNLLHVWYIDDENYPEKSKFAKELLRILDDDEINLIGKASKIKDEDYVKAPRANYGRARKPINVFKYETDGKSSTNISEEFLENESYIYTGYYKDYCDNEGKKLSRELIGNERFTDEYILKYVCEVIGQPVYAIRRAKLRYPVNNPNAINIREKFDEIRNSIDFEDILIKLSSSGTDYYYGCNLKRTRFAPKLLKLFGLIEKDKTNLSNLEWYFINADRKYIERYNKYSEIIENKTIKMKKIYPLAARLDLESDIKEYMDLVDFKNKHEGKNNG